MQNYSVIILISEYTCLVFFASKGDAQWKFLLAGFFGVFENITQIEVIDSLSLEMLCSLCQGETNAASSESGILNGWKCYVWRKYQPTASFPTLPIIFNIKKSFVEVPWDVIKYDLTNYFQLWKIHQKLKNMKAKKQLKKRQWESHTFVICKVYYWCYLIKLPKS